MFRSKATIKILSLFVVAFVCLNASGMACLAYCFSPEAEEETQHCPLQKKADDCDKSESDAVFVEIDRFDCCSIAVSFFAAPLEKHSYPFDAQSETASTSAGFAAPIFAAAKWSNFSYNYRCPPLDRRSERLKHCILRI